ncbi:uncharacterized protein IWZ02DRAFT_58858 [Phyllosticta citriasiana]|uniref:Uncharacterized protein n=1 Tax=Phyllosticta citriasiana TaxID=595635 RepID=A0ABR1L3E4_9PEZI
MSGSALVRVGRLILEAAPAQSSFEVGERIGSAQRPRSACAGGQRSLFVGLTCSRWAWKEVDRRWLLHKSFSPTARWSGRRHNDRQTGNLDGLVIQRFARDCQVHPRYCKLKLGVKLSCPAPLHLVSACMLLGWTTTSSAIIIIIIIIFPPLFIISCAAG